MQDLAYSHPYVDSVSMADDGKQISLVVEVTDFIATGGTLEISGQATQVSGAFANISAYVDVKDAVPGDNNETRNGQPEMFVTVTVPIAATYRFRKDLDVTIFVRVSKVWVTVLGESTQVGASEIGQNAVKGTKWNTARGVTQVDGKTWAAGQSGASAGGTTAASATAPSAPVT